MVSLTVFRSFSCRISSWNFGFPVHQLQSTPWCTYRFIWNRVHLLLLLPCGTFSNLPPRSFTFTPTPTITLPRSHLLLLFADTLHGQDLSRNIRLELWIQWVSNFFAASLPMPQVFVNLGPRATAKIIKISPIPCRDFGLPMTSWYIWYRYLHHRMLI